MLFRKIKLLFSLQKTNLQTKYDLESRRCNLVSRMYYFVYRTYKIKHIFYHMVAIRLPYEANNIPYLEVLRNLFNGVINVNIVK